MVVKRKVEWHYSMGDSSDCPRWLPGDRSGLMEHHAAWETAMTVPDGSLVTAVA